MFRKIAREAVIFMLAGMVLSAVAVFMYSYRDQAQHIRVERNALKTTCDAMTQAQAQAEAARQRVEVDLNDLEKCVAFNGATKIKITKIDLAYADALAEGIRIKNLNVNVSDCGLAGGVGGGFGFVGGVGVWLFYRLVRFAIKG